MFFFEIVSVSHHSALAAVPKVALRKSPGYLVYAFDDLDAVF